MTAKADICLLLEGTYPYVGGGVAAWMHQIIEGLPEITFAVVFLGGAKDDYGDMKYKLPKNVVHLEAHYLSESYAPARKRVREANQACFREAAEIHEFFRDPNAKPKDEVIKRVLASIGEKNGILREDFLHSEAAWEEIRSSFNRLCQESSFIDYFWTVRIMHAPIFMLAALARKIPPARAFHSISTGYAGLLGVYLTHTQGRPFILTEHGIYTKERKIDLAQAKWIKDVKEVFSGELGGDVNYFRKLWIRFFEGIGRLTYNAANPIIALYEGNRQKQIQDGAPPERTRVIPNGVAQHHFGLLLGKRPEKIPPVIGLIGRVVPIKDVKTFVRAMSTVCARMPEASGWIVGTEEQDKGYSRECRDLVAALGLTDKVKFLGNQDVTKILPQLGLLVLSSISEALPLAVIEAFASGLPAVTTDVGSCRELLEGRLPADRALGSAGQVVPIADPTALGRAILSVIGNDATWKAAQQAGLARVEKFYTMELMLGSYRDIYNEAVARA